MTKKATAIIQARMSSSRLPGKVLKKILGWPMLLLMIERVKRSELVDKVIVATSTSIDDEAIVDFCSRNSVECFRGNLEDVLDRYYQSAKFYKADPIVRLTGDCPLIEPTIIDKCIKEYFDGHPGLDIVSNTIDISYPDGLDVSVFSFKALELAWKQAKLPSEREHVVPWIIKNADCSKGTLFKSKAIVNSTNFSDWRWTVDEPEDFEFVKRIYEFLYQKNSCFSWQDIIALVEQQPQLQEINQGKVRDEGYLKSLKNE